MLQKTLQAAAAVVLKVPVSAADSAAATSGWVAVPISWKGDVAFILLTGDNTGSSTHKIQTADDSSGTGAVDVTFTDGIAKFTDVAADNSKEVKVAPRTALKAYVKHVAVVTTGPCVLSSVMVGEPDNT
jgi:hypothetical protein